MGSPFQGTLLSPLGLFWGTNYLKLELDTCFCAVQAVLGDKLLEIRVGHMFLCSAVVGHMFLCSAVEGFWDGR